jgi:hypothetical protein
VQMSIIASLKNTYTKAIVTVVIKLICEWSRGSKPLQSELQINKLIKIAIDAVIFDGIKTSVEILLIINAKMTPDAILYTTPGKKFHKLR